MSHLWDDVKGEAGRALHEAYVRGFRDGLATLGGQTATPPSEGISAPRDKSPHAVAERVLAVIRAAPAGVRRADIGALTGDDGQAVSKALQALKEGRKIMNYGHCWKVRTNRPVPPIEAA